jgi:ABC-type sugar transport system ATPase subunit
MLSKLVLSIHRHLAAKGIASLLVEQNMRAALKMADRAYVLRVGRIVGRLVQRNREGGGHARGVPGRLNPNIQIKETKAMSQTVVEILAQHAATSTSTSCRPR